MYRIDKASIFKSLLNWDYRDFMKYAIGREKFIEETKKEIR